jgi:hypothetical protein
MGAWISMSSGRKCAYMMTFTINIPPMLAYIPYYTSTMDPMGKDNYKSRYQQTITVMVSITK